MILVIPFRATEHALEIPVTVRVTASYAQTIEISALPASKDTFKVTSLGQVVFKLLKHTNVRFKDVQFATHLQLVKPVLRIIN